MGVRAWRLMCACQRCLTRAWASNQMYLLVLRECWCCQLCVSVGCLCTHLFSPHASYVLSACCLQCGVVACTRACFVGVCVVSRVHVFVQACLRVLAACTLAPCALVRAVAVCARACSGLCASAAVAVPPSPTPFLLLLPLFSSGHGEREGEGGEEKE